LVTNAEAIAVRGYSSFKSSSATYAAIYTNNELNGTGVLTPHILFNNNGANRGGFGYHTDNSSLIMANHNDIMFKTGATQLGGTERLRITSDGNVDVKGGELGISTNTNNTSVLTFKNSVKDHKIGGVCVNLADDTISSDIMVPGARHGCLLMMFATSDASGTYPQPGPVGFVYVDVGASPIIRPMYTQGGTGADATTNVGASIVGLDGSETDINQCADNKVTVMKGSANGRFRLANRLNGTYHFYLTMM